MRPNLINRLKEEWNNLDPVDPLRGLIADAIDALTQPAQPSQRSVKPWVGLTDEQLHDLLPTVQIKDEKPEPMVWLTRKDAFAFARAIEAKLREKNA